MNHLCGPDDVGMLSCSNSCVSPQVDSFGQRQALTKQLASIVDFAMAYDDYKMVNPAISNDFSYYRRSMSGMKLQGNRPLSSSSFSPSRGCHEVSHH